MNIWRNNPGMITHDQALNSEDADIKEFAKSLDENSESLSGIDCLKGNQIHRQKFNNRLNLTGTAL